MRHHGIVASAFWTSLDVAAYSEAAKLLALYSLTCPHSNMVGVYRLTNGTVSDDLGWPTDRVSDGLGELHRRGFATRCERSKWLVIHKYLLWNPVLGPKQRAGMVKVIKTMPRGTAISNIVWEVVRQYVQDLEPDRLRAIELHLEPSVDPSTLPIPLGIGTLPIAGTGTGTGTGTGRKAGDGHSAAPPAEEPDKPTAQIAEAFSEAYLARYRVPATINSKVLKQFAQLYGRLGSPAAAVAVFYVKHDRKVYVESQHCVDLLLRDAEGLNTELQRKAFPSLALQDWWSSVAGIREEGKRREIPWEDDDTIASYTAKVYVAAGDGPWMRKLDPLVASHIEQLRARVA